MDSLDKAMVLASKAICWCHLEWYEKPVGGTARTEKTLLMVHPAIPKEVCHAEITYENGNIHYHLHVSFSSKDYPSEDFFIYFDQFKEDLEYL